jgi:hypothetical protein
MNGANPNDTGWQQITPIAGDGDRSMTGRVPQAVVIEHRPCVRCTRFVDDNSRLRQHLKAKGIEIRPDGVAFTPIKMDFPGKKIGMEIQVADFGWCNKEGMVMDKMQSCGSWVPVSRLAAIMGGVAKP